MKLNLILALGMMSFGGAASANEVTVYCELVSKKVDGERVLGVKVANYEMGYEQTSWFGTNSGFQMIARDACIAILDSIGCTKLESTSASATMMVDKDLNEHLDSITLNGRHGGHPDISGLNLRAFENMTSCNEQLSELAHEMIRNVQKKYLQNPNLKFFEEPVKKE